VNGPLERWAALIGRVLLCLVYLRGGLGNLTHWSGTSDYIATKSMPLPADLLTLGAVVFALGGGTLVVLGLFARLGALLLIVFTVPTLVYFHNYWTVADAGERLVETTNFWRNVGLIGGLSMVLAFGPGPISVDAWLRHRSEQRTERF